MSTCDSKDPIGFYHGLVDHSIEEVGPELKECPAMARATVQVL
jgi:hypothetical protein